MSINGRELADIPFLFIVGRPRSGTTLLRMLFDAHPNVCIPPESHLIINLYPRYGKISDWSRDDILSFLDDLNKQWLFDTWPIDRDKLRQELLKMTGRNSYGDICKKVYLQSDSLYPKEEILLFGDKNPGYTIYTEKLLKIFPSAKFVHIVREYKDNFTSVKSVDFELPVVSMVVQKWKYFYRHFEGAKSRHPESHLTLRYEDLVSEPGKHMQQLCAFAGIDFLPEIFNFHEKKEEMEEAPTHELVEKYQQNLMKKINKGRIGIWKKHLTSRQVRIADLTAGKLAEKAGYEREYKGFNGWLWLQSVPGRSLAWSLRQATKVVDTFPYRLRQDILNRWPWRVASFLGKFRQKHH